tara:strand:- start:1765 stop:2727 length:963 start_codon:yes stop_codon:yes gene_type:complete
MNIVKLSHIPDFENPEIQVVDDYKMDVPDHLPQGFFSLLSVGSSGSGKTNGTLNLIAKLKPYYNRYMLISPTGCYDEERKQRAEKKYDKLKIDFDEEHKQYHRGLITEITMRQREKLIEYEEWKRYKDVYARFEKFLSANKARAAMEPVMWGFPELDILLKYDFAHPSDETYFPTQIVPTAMLIIDDMASTPIYTNALGELIELQMKNRHYKMSVLNLVQAYKLCPRSIRLNSSVMMLFPCKSEKMIKEFADTCNNRYTPEQFLKMFDYATKDKPYDFLYIDCREDKGFRKNFNERIDVVDVVGEEGTPSEEVVSDVEML